MTTSIIDGTVEETELGRSRGGTTVLKSISFKLDDGSSRTVRKAVVKQAIADELTPGARARFYLFNAFDIKGIHGVRTPDGRAVYDFPASNRKLFLILGIINLVWIVFTLATRGGVPLLGVALLILAGVGWYFMGKGETEAKRQFEADAGQSGAEAPTRPH
jgi:hypothetical protein